VVTLESSSQGWVPLTHDSRKEYTIINEDSLINIWGKGMTAKDFKKINADLRISVKAFEKPISLDFANAQLSKDTLNTWISGFPGHYWFSHKISILKNNYQAILEFGDDEGNYSKITTLSSQLILNSLDINVGKEIKGHIEYEGMCDNCTESWRAVKIKGSFKVLIGG